MMTPTLIYRDDGPLAEGLGRLWRGGPSPLFAVVPAVVAAAVLPFAVIGRSGQLALLAAAWCALVGGLSSQHPHGGRLDWVVPPVLRVTEYVFLAAVGLAGGAAPGLVFVVLGALAYHHYDTVYRVRQRGEPAPWVRRTGLGWDGRMLVAGAAAAAHVVPGAYLALAGALWLIFVGESVTHWLRGGPRGAGDVDLEGVDA